MGAGIRELHGKAQAAIREHLTLQPVLGGSEGETIEVPAGFDPSAIMVTGNVVGSPPYRGVFATTVGGSRATICPHRPRAATSSWWRRPRWSWCEGCAKR